VSAGRVGDPIDAAGHLNRNGYPIVRNAARNSCVAVSWGRGVAVRSRVPSDPRLPVMAIEVSVPGTADLQLQHLLLDVNGALTTAGG
jgi:hypothetical protein